MRIQPNINIKVGTKFNTYFKGKLSSSYIIVEENIHDFEEEWVLKTLNKNNGLNERFISKLGFLERLKSGQYKIIGYENQTK